MPTKAQLVRHFKRSGAQPSPTFLSFAQYSGKHESISGNFEFELHDLTPWFDGDHEAAKQFIAFGQSGDGGSYAFWLRDSLPVAKAPVVFLGSEGTDCKVLAQSFEDFLSLLAVGANDLGHGSVKLQGTADTGLVGFRKWLKDTLNISVPKAPATIVKKAQAAHTGLMAWVRDWQDGHFANKNKKVVTPPAANPKAALARWNDAETFHYLVGTPDQSRELLAFLKPLGTVHSKEEKYCKEYKAPDKGLIVELLHDEATECLLVYRITLCSHSSEDYKEMKGYRGKLPRKLKWSDRRFKIPLKLGKPELLGQSAYSGPKDKYRVGASCFIVVFSQTDNGKIDIIMVDPLPTKKR